MIDKKAEGEIIQSYRLAKDQLEQINILAELYAVPTARIRGILYAGGVYKIGPRELVKAAEKIENGASFGALRNYSKDFAGHDAKSAKKVFNDFIYMPWGAETPEDTKDAVLRVNDALEAARQRKENQGPERKQKPTKTDPPAAAPIFTDAQAGILIAGLLMVLAEQEARANLLKHEINRLQTEAAELINQAEKKIQEANDLQKEITENRGLLEQVKQLKTKQPEAAAVE